MVNFTTISHTKGQGTTMNMTNYAALDEAPLAGTSYYRLVQVDFDGTTTFSKSVAVTTNSLHTPSLSIYPNPSTGPVNATLTSESASEAFSATVLVTDITGKVVATKLISELTSSAKVNLLDGTENLPAGFYSVTIINGTSTQTLKLQLLN